MKKRSVLTMVVATLLVVAMTVSADAQGRRGGGQGGRGQGGRGGQMMMGRGGFGGGISLLQLAQIEVVQKDIEMVDDQIDGSKKLAEEVRAQRGERGGGGDRPNIREMSETERTKFFEDMRKEQEKRTAETEAKLGKILFIPGQMDRLSQIQLQTRGIRALQDEKVAAKLKITAKQKADMEEASEEAGTKMREEMQKMFQGVDRANIDRDAMRTKMTELGKKRDDAVLAALTAAQKKEFAAMQGEKLEIPREAMFGGRGGQPGGGRGGRGGQQGGGDQPQRKQRPGV